MCVCVAVRFGGVSRFNSHTHFCTATGALISTMANHFDGMRARQSYPECLIFRNISGVCRFRLDIVGHQRTRARGGIQNGAPATAQTFRFDYVVVWYNIYIYI